MSRWSRGHQTPSASHADNRVEDADDVDSALLPASQPNPALQAASSVERPRECVNRHPTPAFSLLCTMMDRMRSEEASRRRDTLTRFIDLWRVKVGTDLYPLIRLLLPDRDRERPVYNLKEAMLAKCYIEVLGLDKHSDAALRLIKWKQPIEGQSESHSGDFARVCYHEIAARSTVEEGQLSVEAVNALLDQLASGRMKQQEYVPVLRKVNQQCTPVEQEWIIRIILKDLRISIREKGVFSCFHPDAGDLFNVCSDLKRVCWTLYKPEIRLEKHQAHVELFRSFLPQLCYRSPTSSHEAIAKMLGGPGKDFVMEEKLDGERMQLHMRGSGAQWFYCSRKAKDYTYLYGAHPAEGSLTPHIASALREDVRNVILDGEMLVWDPILEKYVAFGTLKTAALDQGADENAPRPCFKVFDVLFLNDVCLTNKRLSERKRLLRSNRIFHRLEDYKGRLEFAEEQTGRNGKDILRMLERILESKGEGLVVKRTDCMYQTNYRGADWIKVKPEYSDQMGENLDLLVLGGWWGKGGRTGKISSLLCGLRVPQEDDGGSQGTPTFTSFCKIGSGMSYEDYEWILNKHKEHWLPFDRSKPPAWLKLGPTGLDDKPDVYIRPEHSFVVEVKASEIVPAVGNFGIGYTMRFPRCRYIYWDKASRDHPLGDDSQDRDMWNSLSVDEFLALINKPKRKYEDGQEGSSRRKRRRVQPKKKVELVSAARGQRLGQTVTESTVFSGFTFYIIKGTPSHSKADLESLVHEHGGHFTQAQLADRSALVIASDTKHILVRAQMNKDISVIHPKWILASIERRTPLPFIESLLVYASELDRVGRYFHKALAEIDLPTLVRDRSGEAYTMPDPRSHAETDFIEAAIMSDFEVDSNDSHDSEPEEPLDDPDYLGSDPLLPMAQGNGNDFAAPGASQYDTEKIFRHLVFYIDSVENAVSNELEISDPSSASRARLNAVIPMIIENGGHMTVDLQHAKLSHVIMDDDDSKRYAEILRKTSKPKRKHIVLPSWIDECLEEETLMNEDGHKPK